MIQETLQKHYSSLNEDSSGKYKLLQLVEIQERIHNCGKGIPFRCNNPLCFEQRNEEYRRVIRQYCGIRICQNKECIEKRKQKIQKSYQAKLNSFKDPRFLTLTLKGYHPMKKEVLSRLNYAWKRLSVLLRKSGFIRSYIKVAEFTQHEWVDVHGEYHFTYFWHLHVLYDGVYIAAELLRTAWKQYTKDSTWIHITRVKKNFSASAYLTKYLNKLATDDLDIDEYMSVYKMKLISSWNCKEEMETILEFYILATQCRCPFCNTKLYPENQDNSIP